MNEMELNEALETTRQFLHHFRSVEKLDEVMKVAIKSGTILAENQKRQRNIEINIEELEKRKKNIQNEINQKIEDSEKDITKKLANLVSDLSDKTKEYDSTIEKLQASFDKKSEELKSAIAELDTKKAIVDAESKGFIDEHKEKMADLQEQATKEEAKLVATQKALADIKSKI